MTSENKKMLTSAEAAEFLGLSEGTLRNLRAKKKNNRPEKDRERRPRPPHYKIGKAIRYRLSDLEDFLKLRHK